ncbi:MAG: hypothetical protein WCF65_10160, partial [Parachlamydiaceae bacterium]
MRTSTVLGISVCLSAGVLLGWIIANIKPEISADSLQHISEVVSNLDPQPQSLSLPVPQPQPQPLALKQSFDSARIEKLLKSSRALEAISLLSDVSPDIDLSSEEGREWLRLLVDAYETTNNVPQLLLIYRQVPAALSSNERATLMVADALMAQQNIADYRPLRRQWLGKETEKSRWMFLDVQESINIGKPSEAVAILSANHFEGKDETERLVRLAAIFVINDPKRAWNYLSEAAQNDPSNPDVFTFRATLNEKLKQHEGAGSDYIIAVKNDSENPYRREQLADFYIRTEQYVQALKVLQDAVTRSSLDSIWLKTLFWGRVVGPSKHMWGSDDIPEGPLKELVVYLDRLPTGMFWSQQSFNKLPNAEHYLETAQETFWLRLLSTLKAGDETATLELIDNNSFIHLSWQPGLENGLRTLIIYRQSQKSTPDGLSPAESIVEIDSPQQLLSLLSSLSELSPTEIKAAIPQGLHAYLVSGEAFVAPFLAAGWTEAAIQLHTKKELPDSFPEWVAVALTQALNENRSPAAALEFAQGQTPSPQLSLLIAELALSIDRKDVAFTALKGIYTTDNSHGQRAALILGQFLMDNDN